MNKKNPIKTETAAIKTRQSPRAAIGCQQASQTICRPLPPRPSFRSAPPLHQLPLGRGERPDGVNRKKTTMKTKIATLIALTVGLSALHAQSDTAPASGRQTGSTQRAKPATPLVVATLDANHDGVIDAVEIKNAVTALKSLDKNADGRLSRVELRRSRPTRPVTTEASTRPMKKRSSAEGSETERRN